MAFCGLLELAWGRKPNGSARGHLRHAEPAEALDFVPPVQSPTQEPQHRPVTALAERTYAAAFGRNMAAEAPAVGNGIKERALGETPAPEGDAYARAVALHAKGRVRDAEAAYRAALAADPDHGAALHGLGVLYLQTGRIEAAIGTLQKAVTALGGAVTVCNNLGVALCTAKRFAEAAEVYREALQLEPDSVPSLVNLGKILSFLGNHRDATQVLRHAVEVAPDRADVHGLLAMALAAGSDTQAALTHFDRAVELAPNFALAHFNRGTALTYMGRKAEAAKAFARAVELDPDDAAFRRAMLGIERVTASNVHLKALEKTEAVATDTAEQIARHFALAKAYEDIGDYPRAFAEMSKGNVVKRRVGRYKLQNDLDRFRALATTFTAEFLAAHAGSGFATEVPVFVIGMPRSGTTLIEQILSSHPDVYGAGEQGILPRFINAGRAGRDFPTAAKNLAAAAWSALGNDYAQELGALAPNAARIVDKLPLNFQLVGLIHLAMPGARIIHVIRDPLDTCFSCYSILFDDDLDFSCDLADLGRYYNGYRRLMDHWRTVLPPGAMLEIRYENLVADPERETRRLIDYCGLAWNARCLKFHETDRAVQTASALQVRQPLYNSSVGRAASYAPWLEPLRRVLADTAES